MANQLVACTKASPLGREGMRQKFRRLAGENEGPEDMWVLKSGSKERISRRYLLLGLL